MGMVQGKKENLQAFYNLITVEFYDDGSILWLSLELV